MQSTYSSAVQKILRNVILYGLPILYFLIAVCFYLKTYDSAQIKITLIHVGGFFLLMNWLVLKIEEGDFSFFREKFVYMLPVLLFLVSGIISFLNSSFEYASFNELTKRILYCGLALIIMSEFDDEKKLMRIFNWLIAATFIACIYGLIQFIDYKFFPPPPDLGLDPFAWRQAFANRIFSTFGNPNFYGDFLIVMSPIAAALAIYKKKIYLIILWVMIALCTFFTFSKGAWLGFASGTFVFIITYLVIFLRNKLNRKMVMTFAISAVVIVCIVAFGIVSLSKKRTDSVSFRIFTWLSAWEMVNTNPVWGTGIGSFYVAYPSWRRPQIFFIEAKHNTESDHPENEFLEVWYDEGIIGFTIFLLLIAFVFTAGYKNMMFYTSGKGTRDGPEAYIQLGVFAAFAAQLAHDTVCVSLRFVSSGVMLWLLIGVTISLLVNTQKDKSKKAKSLINSPLKIIFQLLVIIPCIYMMFYLYGYFKADYLHSQAIGYSKQANWDIALKTYDEVNKYNPTFPMSKYFKGNVHLDRWGAGDPIMTEKAFFDLWKIAPNYVQSKYYAGLMYEKMWQGSIQMIEESKKEKKPESVIMQHSAKASEYFNKALRYYNEYRMIDPVFPQTYYRMASMFAQVGDIARAEAILIEHLNFPEKLSKPPHSLWYENWTSRRMNEYSETYSQLGLLYWSQGKKEESKNMYLKSIELFPGNFFARKNLASIYQNLGDVNNADRQWVEVIKINQNDEDARKYLLARGIITINK